MNRGPDISLSDLHREYNIMRVRKLAFHLMKTLLITLCTIITLKQIIHVLLNHLLLLESRTVFYCFHFILHRIPRDKVIPTMTRNGAGSDSPNNLPLVIHIVSPSANIRSFFFTPKPIFFATLVCIFSSTESTRTQLWNLNSSRSYLEFQHFPGR